MKQACLLIGLLVLFIAPAAFGCAQCKSDLQQCPVCLETDYDGGQYCLMNDIVGCQERRVCFGSSGYEFCGGPCIPYPNLAETHTPPNGWEVASVRFVPPAKLRSRRA
jgi:hypothetical protein